MSKSQWDPERPGGMPWLMLSMVLFALVSTGGVLFHGHAMADARARLREEVTHEAVETARIAESSVAVVRAQAEALRASPFFAAAVDEYMKGGSPEATSGELLVRRLESEREAGGLSGIALLDPSGDVMLASPRGSQASPCSERSDLKTVVRTGEILLMDCIDGDPTQMGLIVPIHESGDPSGRVIGIVCERFTLAQETVLVAAHSDSPYARTFLVRGSDRPVAVSLDTSTDPARVRSVSTSDVASIDGDPRDRMVSESPVRGTQWKVVVTSDPSEMTRGAQIQTAILAMVSVLAFASAGVSMRPLWERRTGEYRRLLQKSQADHDLLSAHVELLSKYANDVILLLDEEYRVVMFNDRALRAYGRNAEDMLGLRFAVLVDDYIPGSWEVRLAALGDDGAVYDSVHIRSDGTHFPVECSARCIDVEGRVHYQLIVRDISSRRNSELEISRYQSRLKALASELVMAEERERHRIATLLHDSVGQNLAVISMRLEMAASAGEENDALREVRQSVATCLADTRNLTRELSPPVLYELGLEPALDWLAELFGDRHGLPCEVVADGKPKPLGKDVRSALFSAVRELLMNVVKHANASSARITVNRREDQIIVIVSDDGVGFNLERDGGLPWSGDSFGLFSVRERVDYLGGLMLVDTAEGMGTTVTLVAPLEPDDEVESMGEEGT